MSCGDACKSEAAPATVSSESLPFHHWQCKPSGKVGSDFRAASQETCRRELPILRAVSAWNGDP